MALQESQVLHDLQVVAKEEHLGALDVDRSIVVRWCEREQDGRRRHLPIWLGDHVHGDGAGVTTPSPQIEVLVRSR